MARGHEEMVNGSPALLFDSSVAHLRPDIRLLAGREGQLRRRPGGGRAAIRAFPGIVLAARANRAFLARAVRYLAADAGIRQFLDIGTGMPAGNNTHEVAQSVAPDSRIVYVDNDPIVLSHARALLTSTARVPPRTWTPTCAIRRRSSPRRRDCSTSASPWR